MGLDMYLTKETYIGAKFEHRNVTGSVDVAIDGKPVDIQINKLSTVVEEVGYWRKANAIHKWFVENVQDGVDDCRKYLVTNDNLCALLDAVNQVLESTKTVPGVVINGHSIKAGDEDWIPNFESGENLADSSVAEEVLPSTSGFFFGSTDYDQWYWQDLELTKKIIEPLIGTESFEVSYYYRASW